MLAVIFHWLLAHIQGLSLHDYVSKYGEQKKANAGFHCLLVWMLVSAIQEKKLEQIIKICSMCDLNKLNGKSIVACVEAAIWQNDKQIAEQLLGAVEDMQRARPETMRYLRGLYAWRFSKDLSVVLEMRDVPMVAVFDFVLSFARATVLDEQGNNNDALIFYRRALKAMPYDAPQHKHAMERCNVLLNA